MDNKWLTKVFGSGISGRFLAPDEPGDQVGGADYPVHGRSNFYSRSSYSRAYYSPPAPIRLPTTLMAEAVVLVLVIIARSRSPDERWSSPPAIGTLSTPFAGRVAELPVQTAVAVRTFRFPRLPTGPLLQAHGSDQLTRGPLT